MPKTITLTDDAVRKMAAQCGDADRILRAGIPEAFEPVIDLTKLYVNPSYVYQLDFSPAKIKAAFDLACQPSGHPFAVRTSGNYAKQGFYLMKEGFIWVIKTDNTGQQVLLPIPQPPLTRY